MKDREMEREMGRLSLRLLGTPEVHHLGQPLAFPTRKALALLVYLAVQGNRHSREKLSALLWPESETEQGRAILRRTLAFLRQTLGELSAHPGTSHLLVEREALGFNFASEFELDLHTLKTLLAVTHPQTRLLRVQAADLQEPVRRHLVSQLEQAIDLYRGDFLESFSLEDAPDFDRWVGAQRAYWHQQIDRVFGQLSQLAFEGGELQKATQITSRWLNHDPFNEVAYRGLMQVYVAAGDRSAALQTYERCREMLAKEFQAEPAAETEALAERVRAKVSFRRMPLRKSRVDGPSLADIAAPLTGRASEHGRLVMAYRSLRQGVPQVAIITGEAGIGKTRLASEFLNWAASEGADILEARAFETGGSLPYQPLVEALRSRVSRENAPDDLLSDTWLSELSRLLPELRDRYPDLPSPTVDETTAQTRLFEAVTLLGEALAQRAPLVVFIDDLQWADVASLDLLHYAGRRWQKSHSPILLFLCLRSEALTSTSKIADWLARLQRDLPTTSLTLGSLPLDETLQLLRALTQITAEQPAPGAPGRENIEQRQQESRFEQFGRWLFAESGGQPFFLIETLKALVEQGRLVARRDQERGWMIEVETSMLDDRTVRGWLPSSIRELIRARLARLSPSAHLLLTAAAVLGHGFTFETLCNVAGLEETAGLASLDEVLAGHLLHEGTAESEERSTERHFPSTRYFFTHDKIRDVVYTEAGDARRRIFHWRALEALQANHAPAAELALHARGAQLAEAAFRWSLAAGDQAMQLFAMEDAITCYEQAKALATENMSVPIATADSYHLSLQLGRAYELTKAYDQARMIYEEMLTLARQAHEPLMECKLLNRLAHVMAQESFDLEAMLGLLQQAQRVAEESGDQAGLAETEWNLAQLGFYSWKPEAALLHAERGLALAQELGLRELMARCLNVLAYAERMLGKWEDASFHAEAAHDVFAELSNRAMEADCLCLLADTECMCGRPREGITAGYAARAICQEIGNLWGQAHSTLELTPVLLDIGAYGEALDLAQQGVDLARAQERKPQLVFCLARLGAVYRALFAVELARTIHLEALALCATLPSLTFSEMIASELCADCVGAGRWEEAHSYALQAMATRNDALLQVWRGLWQQTEALLRSNEGERARQNLQHFGERMKDTPRCRIEYLRAHAILAQWEGEIDQAMAHLQEAAGLAQKMGFSGEHWQIELGLGELYQLRGDESTARQAFSLAQQLVQSIVNQIKDEKWREALLTADLIQRIPEYP